MEVPWIQYLHCGHSAEATLLLWYRLYGRRCAGRVVAPSPWCRSPGAEIPPDHDLAEELRPVE